MMAQHERLPIHSALMRGSMYATIGLVVNTAVALGAAVWSPLPRLERVSLQDDRLRWGMPVPETWPRPTTETIYRSAVHTVIAQQSISRPARPNRQPIISHVLNVHRFGWPARSLQLSHRMALTSNQR